MDILARLHPDDSRLILGSFYVAQLVRSSIYHPDNTVVIWDIRDNTRPYMLCKKTAVGLFYLSAHNCLFLLEHEQTPPFAA